MAHWIKERLAQRRAIEERKSRIGAEANAIYVALIAHLEEDVALANQEEAFKDDPIIAEGSAPTHNVIFRNKAKGFRVLLGRRLDFISIEGSIHRLLEFDVTQAGVVVLKDNYLGLVSDLREVAKWLLDPLLFPDLSPQDQCCEKQARTIVGCQTTEPRR